MQGPEFLKLKKRRKPESNSLKRAHRRKLGETLKELLTGTGLPTRPRPVKKERVPIDTDRARRRRNSPAAKRRKQEERNRAFSP